MIRIGLVASAAFLLAGFTGPDPRDATTNKPSPEACAEAQRQNRTLTGCAAWSDGEESSGEIDSAEENPAPRRPEAFRVCPGDPRCPRRAPAPGQ